MYICKHIYICCILQIGISKEASALVRLGVVPLPMNLSGNPEEESYSYSGPGFRVLGLGV